MNNKTNKNILLIIILIIVVGAIYYLSSQKVSVGNIKPADLADAPDTYIKNEEAIEQKKGKYSYAPELTGIEGYINTDESITIGSLKGKVILIDFWTYTCINCIRTLPHLKNWHKKYEDDGLVIIGVHTPEFEFEKINENVVEAVKEYGLEYPIVQDNSYATWSAFKNRYWPHKFLIDIDGFIRYDHIGEGSYEETEKVIQELLKERMERLGKGKLKEDLSKPGDVVSVEVGKIGTPELYFGYKFARQDIGNTPGIQPGQTVEYKLPSQITKNIIYLGGTWKFNEDDAELISEEGTLMLGYDAKIVNIVAGSDTSSTIEVLVNTNYLSESQLGKDVEIVDKKSTVEIQEGKLYNIVDHKYEPGLLELRIKGKGFKINTFTFG